MSQYIIIAEFRYLTGSGTPLDYAVTIGYKTSGVVQLYLSNKRKALGVFGKEESSDNIAKLRNRIQ